jgi:radical SAM-linked protein
VNRLRVRFARGQELKFISHLDLTRLWHRALRRAGIVIAYSEGFNPHPRLSLAVPLQLGATSQAELMDVYTVQPVAPQLFTTRVRSELPAGLDILQTLSVGLQVPALQAQVRFVDYRVRVQVLDEITVSQAIGSLLSKTSLPWNHRRDTGTKSYDLRPLIVSLQLADYAHGLATLDMRLRCDARGTGRPEQVVKALGLDMPLDICRTRLVLEAI